MSNRGNRAPRSRAEKSPWYFTAVLILLPFLVLGSAELLLRAAGIAAPPPVFLVREVDGQRLLVLNPEVARRFFHVGQGGEVRAASTQILPEEKPPATRRILCLGESTTAGFPFPAHGAFPAILQLILEERDPSIAWEVTNLGVTALSSSSVASMMDEILATRPDALVVYLGHNEFYGAGGVATPGAHGPLAALRSLRLVRLLEGLLARAPEGAGEEREALEESRVRAEIPVDSPLRDRAFSAFRKNLVAILERSRRAGVRVILCEVVSNERDHYPFGSEIRSREGLDEITREIARWRTPPIDPLGPVRLLPRLKAAAGRDSTNAGLRYLYGMARLAAGEADGVADLVAARNFDTIPFRAPDPINRILREEGRRHGAVLVPTERLFRSMSMFGAAGSGHFVEHLHPTFLGNAQIASAAADALLGRDSSPIDPRDEARWLASSGLTRLDLAFADARMAQLLDRWPFRRIEEGGSPIGYVAASVLGEAMALRAGAGDSAGMRYFHALDEGEKSFLQRLMSKQTNILEAHLALAEWRIQNSDHAGAALELRAAAALYPIDPAIWLRLARVSLARGDRGGARWAVGRALRWSPGNAEARALLMELGGGS